MSETLKNNIPTWITPTLFEDLLRERFADFVKINNFSVAPAVEAGENYATVMLRVKIEVQLKATTPENVSFLLKLPHDSELFRELTKNFDIFEVESLMYREIVPDFEKLYQSVGLNIKFGPQTYNLKTPNKHILLEDLTPRNFKNINRLEGLDLEHTKSVLKKLAQWHAASAKRVEVKGNYNKVLQDGYFTEAQRAANKAATLPNQKCFVKCANSYKGSAEYVAKLEKLIEKSMDLIYKSAAVNPEEFNVLNHGDCWSNNVMFQYNGLDEIQETFFVDYQISKYGSPAQDLYSLILSSTKLELKLSHFDYFIHYYHEELIKHLKLLNYGKKLPELKYIHIMLHKHSIWGFVAASSVMAVVLLDPNEKANFGNFVSETAEAVDFKQLMFTNARFRSHIEKVLPWLLNRGALDC